MLFDMAIYYSIFAHIILAAIGAEKSEATRNIGAHFCAQYCKFVAI